MSKPHHERNEIRRLLAQREAEGLTFLQLAERSGVPIHGLHHRSHTDARASRPLRQVLNLPARKVYASASSQNFGSRAWDAESALAGRFLGPGERQINAWGPLSRLSSHVILNLVEIEGREGRATRTE
ncbi:MAG: hypothetical protein ACI8X5_002396 [Planctomycetota bacterium]|jgi:hypothetical protein